MRPVEGQHSKKKVEVTPMMSTSPKIGSESGGRRRQRLSQATIDAVDEIWRSGGNEWKRDSVGVARIDDAESSTASPIIAETLERLALPAMECIGSTVESTLTEEGEMAVGAECCACPSCSRPLIYQYVPREENGNPAISMSSSVLVSVIPFKEGRPIPPYCSWCKTYVVFDWMDEKERQGKKIDHSICRVVKRLSEINSRSY